MATRRCLITLTTHTGIATRITALSTPRMFFTAAVTETLIGMEEGDPLLPVLSPSVDSFSHHVQREIHSQVVQFARHGAATSARSAWHFNQFHTGYNNVIIPIRPTAVLDGLWSLCRMFCRLCLLPLLLCLSLL